MLYGAGERKTHGTGEALSTIVARCRLPIRVKPTLNNVGVWIGWRDEDGVFTSVAHTWGESADAYLALCRSLTPASRADPPDAGTAGASAPASLSPPASSLPDPDAVAAEVPPTANASAAISFGAV